MNFFIGSSSVEEIPTKYMNDTKKYLDELLKDLYKTRYGVK